MSASTNYISILDARAKQIFGTTTSPVPEEYSLYTNKVSWQQYQYVLQGVSGLAMGQVISDGQIPISDAPLQGFSKTFTQAIFTQRIRLTKQSYYYLFVSKNGKKIQSDLKSKITDLKSSITHLQNFYGQSLLAAGWTGSASFSPIGWSTNFTTLDATTADGVAYWSAAHLRADGGTNYSTLISNSGFTAAGVNNPTATLTGIMGARYIHSIKKDDRGLPLVGSNLDTVVVVNSTLAHFVVNSIKATLDSGKYPSASQTGNGSSITAGISGSFVDAAPMTGFKIIPLQNYGSTGLTTTSWFMFDSTKVDEQSGFQYIESMPLDLSDLKEDYVGNMDLISTVTLYCQFGAADLRYWMASNGTNA